MPPSACGTRLCSSQYLSDVEHMVFRSALRKPIVTSFIVLKHAIISLLHGDRILPVCKTEQKKKDVLCYVRSVLSVWLNRWNRAERGRVIVSNSPRLVSHSSNGEAQRVRINFTQLGLGVSRRNVCVVTCVLIHYCKLVVVWFVYNSCYYIVCYF